MNQHARVEVTPIPFIDVAAQRRRLGKAIDDATARVLNHCQFLMGPEVLAFEAELAAFCGAKHALSCSSGTDALVMILMAKGVGRGDAVFCPTFTFCATAESAALVGATPVFVDVDADTFNIDAASLKSAVETARAMGLRPKAVIPVDLFGLPADHDAVGEVADAEKLFILDDAAQGFGGTYKGRDIGTFGHATATSFFPAKPLGCYGDGGAVLTDDDELLAILKSVRVHGGGSDKYDNVRLGLTARLDTIQAAVLIEKLKIFRDEIAARNRVAARYSRMLSDVAAVPVVPVGHESVWAQYTIRLAAGKRDGLARALQAEGIPTAIYYAKPLHQQTAYRDFPVAETGLPVSERLSGEVISLPMHAYLDEPTQDRIVDAVKRALR
ncbi:DegT/DnrJ/EryC1/StrS family aminotransferase [Pseudorhodoplanes sp.]|uniref:DegT/DnrJ/EryC1/StrS family aminotransferase n=1 Tax=Pseudorhodoplanes sp. TaxID=1934341 RepID=UPI003D12D6E8